MDRMEADDFSLFGLLGRSWHLGSAVVDLTFDTSDSAVAFSLADGSVAIAKTKDGEPAAKRIRISAEDGRSSILPRTRPLPPITRLAVQDDSATVLTAYGRHGFLIGDGANGLTSLTIGGERSPFATSIRASITALDYAPMSRALACSTTDRQVALIRRDGEPDILDHQERVVALAFSPNGDHLAVICDRRVDIWTTAERSTKVSEFFPSEQPACAAWSPDGLKLALGLEAGGVALWHVGDGTALNLSEYPAPVRSLDWSANSDYLVTSGAFRIIVWPTNQLLANGSKPNSLDTGRPSLSVVEAIAVHPSRLLVAAGSENGMLTLTQIGQQDELIMKTDGLGAIDVVRWSNKAGALAIGSSQGLAAIVELPLQIFK